MHAERLPFYDAEYDGTLYRQVYRLDPRLLVPGIMLTIFSVPLIIQIWPEAKAWAMTGIGVVLSALSFAKRHHFSVSTKGYSISWSLGPFGWTYHFGPDEAEPILVSGKRGHRVWLRSGWQRFELFIEAASRREGEAWIEFLRRVSHGAPAEFPKADDTSVLGEHT